jgi:two-component system alkaline phosphatase synthesis response regulator PhoP
MDENRYRILLADFDQETLNYNTEILSRVGYSVMTAGNLGELRNLAVVFRPHLIIMDLVNKEISAESACMQIRRNRLLHETLIMIYTSNFDLACQNLTLNTLADDFIKKTLSEEDLLNRIRFFLRNVRQITERQFIEFDGILIDVEGYAVRKENRIIDLAKKEFELLLMLASEPRKTFSRKEISEHMWGDSNDPNDRILDVYIAKLRSKIGKNFISTKKGVGYSFIS